MDWKKARKKQYNIYVAMPEKGTIVVNKLEQPDSVRALNGHTWISPQKMEKDPQVKNIAIQLLQAGKAYLVDDAHPFVLAGTVGELWTIKPDQLANKYMFLSEGNPVPINQESLNKKMKDGVLDWTLIRSNPDTSEVYACFVPVSQRGQVQASWAVLQYNAPYVKHGKGDFLIARYTLPNGQPDTSKVSVVNGLVFRDTYDNRGWADCLDMNTNVQGVTIDDLPKFVSAKKTSTKDKGFANYAEEGQQILAAMKLMLVSIFEAEEFATDQGKPVSLTGDGRITTSFEVKEREKAVERGTTIKLALEGKDLDSDKASIFFIAKAIRDGKELTKKFKISDEDTLEKALHNCSIIVYLEFCKLFKMTPFRFITKPRFISQQIQGSHGKGFEMVGTDGLLRDGGIQFFNDANYCQAFQLFANKYVTDNNKYYYIKFMPNNYKANTVPSASASCDFNIELYEGFLDKPTCRYRAGNLIGTYTVTMAIKLDLDKINKAMSDGNALPKGTFMGRLKVANSRWLSLDSPEPLIYWCLNSLILDGYLSEKFRQHSSNAAQKIS